MITHLWSSETNAKSSLCFDLNMTSLWGISSWRIFLINKFTIVIKSIKKSNSNNNEMVWQSISTLLNMILIVFYSEMLMPILVKILNFSIENFFIFLFTNEGGPKGVHKQKRAKGASSFFLFWPWSILIFPRMSNRCKKQCCFVRYFRILIINAVSLCSLG